VSVHASHPDMSFQNVLLHDAHHESKHVSYSSLPTTGVLLPARGETFVLGDNWQDRGTQRNSEHQEYLRSIAHVDGNFSPIVLTMHSSIRIIYIYPSIGGKAN
jgi:hypothetical protein